MTSLSNTQADHRRQFMLLAPDDSDPAAFLNVLVAPHRHRDLLAEAQRLRGKTYLDIGALHRSQLSADGRHIDEADDRSWHLVTLDDTGRVVACLRYLAHPNKVSFSKLTVARCALAQSETWGPKLQVAVETELRLARERGCSYVEMGGWAITEALRCTTEALRMICAAFALAQASGGALGITSANRQSCSAAILRRIGGRGLIARGEELPSYRETEYGSFETEILRFDSLNPNPRYRKWMEACQEHLRGMPVIRRVRNHAFTASFVNTVSFASRAGRQTPLEPITEKLDHSPNEHWQAAAAPVPAG